MKNLLFITTKNSFLFALKKRNLIKMMKLIPRNLRIPELSKIGIPKVFIENIGKISGLIYRVEDVDSAYFYLPQISNYKILESFNVVPIFDEGEIFCVFIYNENKKDYPFFIRK